MMEWPESRVLAKQLNQTVQGRRVCKLQLGLSPHKFFFTNKQAPFLPELIQGQTLGQARALGIYVEIDAGENALLVGEGLALRLLEAGEKRPAKCQLLLELEDGRTLCGSVQMYGGAWAYPAGSFASPYYLAAKEKPAPCTPAFDETYFLRLMEQEKPALSAKAFLATQQRIPGLGNGVLQDILLRAGLNPRQKLGDMDAGVQKKLYTQLTATLEEMERQGGRDTEKNLFGKEGGYRCLLSAKTWKEPCPQCGARLEKQNYLGGSVYICPFCQPLAGKGQ